MRDVACIMRPRSVAVIGASGTRITQGNQVIGNLQRAGFAGRIVPVHASATAMNDLPVTASIAELQDIDTTVVAIPAAGVAACLAELSEAGIRSAVIFTNGFSPAQEQAVRAVTAATGMVVHGPNCMGLIDLHERMPLYPATITAKAHPGEVAVIAQSGSAAISLLNSSSFGISTIVTMGSEFQVTAPDYMRFFAADPRTRVVGIVLESIQSPAEFAEAAALLRAAGKPLAVLKVGRSEIGNRAVQAHTGALISRNDAYERFFATHAIPTARDYDELIATLECFAVTSRRPTASGLAIIGISGGETALACDTATELGLPLAAFSAETTARLTAALSGASANPLDLGSTVGHTPEQDQAAIAAILDAPEVGMLAFIQDAQATLTPTMLNNYTPHLLEYAKHAGATAKPVVLISPSAENTHPKVHEMLGQGDAPVLRGLRAGLVAMRNLATLAGTPTPAPAHAPVPGIAALIAGQHGPLPAALTRKVLEAYGLPLVRAAVAATAEEAVAAAERVGYPLVLKIASPDIPHRSDVGGVALGIRDAAALRTAIADMLARIRAAKPEARIEGFELQEHLAGWVEAMAGFVAAPPFGALLTLGTGGTMVELQADNAVELCPLGEARAAGMIAATRLGRALSGYRNLMPKTDLAPLAALAASLSRLAADLAGQIAECDLNPVLVRPGTGEVRIVDALLLAA